MKETEVKKGGNGKTALIILGSSILGFGLWVLLKRTVGEAQLLVTVVSGEDGKAIQGATVTAGDKSTITDENGKCGISGLPVGKITVTVSASGYITTSKEETLESGGNGRTYQLFKTETKAGLTGVVTDVNTGTPLSGVSVSAEGKTATTDATGSYSLAGLTVGPVTVNFSKQGYKAKSVSITLVAGQNTLNMTMNNRGTITGTVRDSVTHVAIAGVSVQISSYSAITGPAGTYSITMPSGNYTAVISKSGYVTQNQPVTVYPEETRPLDIDLVQEYAQEGVIQGRVTDVNTGNGISGAQVQAGSYLATTNYQGYYSMNVANGSYNVTATASGYNSQTKQVTVTTGTIKTVDFALSPTQVNPGVGQGYVRNASNNQPIAGVKIWINETQAGGALGYVTTSSNGYYYFPAPPGTYYLTTEKEGYSSQTKTIVITSGGTTNLDFALVPSTVQLGFLMSVEFDPSNYPTAALWYADVAGLYNWFIDTEDLWDSRGIDLTTRSWPSTLTVELYDASYNLLARKTRSVTLQNGHLYSFYVEQNQLYDMGMY